MAKRKLSMKKSAVAARKRARAAKAGKAPAKKTRKAAKAQKSPGHTLVAAAPFNSKKFRCYGRVVKLRKGSGPRGFCKRVAA